MEKDIKILKDLKHKWELGPFCDIVNILDLNEIQAIENILARLEQLEKENIRLKYQDIPYLEGTIKGYKERIEELKVNQCDHNISNECIRKSVIRDKIEELDKKIYKTFEGNIQEYTPGEMICFKKILKELLGE